jgi:hypothetical protein
VLAHHPIVEGTFYAEVEVLPAKGAAPFANVEPHIRIGL